MGIELGMLPLFAIFQNLGPMELVVILGLGLLLFGKRLPEVGRSLGRGIVEFKKGLRGVEDEIDKASYESSKPQTPQQSERVKSESPKFEIPTPEPAHRD